MESIEKEKHIAFAFLHGSSLEYDKFHDIDIALFIQGTTIEQVRDKYEIELSIELEEKIGSKVDITIINDAKLGFQYQVLKGKLLYCKDYEIYYEFGEKVLRYYFDFQPLTKIMLSDIKLR